VQNRLSAAFDGWYTDRLLSLSGVELGSYVVVNATLLARDLHKHFEVSASVHNLFNKYYADPGGFEHHEASIPQDRRTAQLQLTYRFASKTR
jgi:outer membrane receptor protein involved in Fe transport